MQALLRFTFGCLLLLGTSLPATAQGKVFLTVNEALKLAFPKCDVERTIVSLTAADKKRLTKLSGLPWKKSLVFPYVAKKDGKVVGTAYFDAHKVRTLRETVMFVVAPNETIQRIEILAFGEPTGYLPRAKWYAQFVGRKLDAKLQLKRSIKTVAGATLTARATTGAARRTLALHRVLAEKAKAPQPKPRPKVTDKTGGE
ncbi:MAG: FMN-binding protein [bacterium]|nr:FMN-binding protein [bacterium]